MTRKLKKEFHSSPQLMPNLRVTFLLPKTKGDLQANLHRMMKMEPPHIENPSVGGLLIMEDDPNESSIFKSVHKWESSPLGQPPIFVFIYGRKL